MDIIDDQHLAGEAALLQAPKQLDQPGAIAVASQPHIVIIGAGFAGLSAAKALAKASVHVTIIDRRNYHLFQPLLYQVAAAGLSPADIAMPIRSILSRQRNAIVVLARVMAIDTATRIVSTDAREIPYDILIVATGARHAYFGPTSGKASRSASRRSRTRPTSGGRSCCRSNSPRIPETQWSAIEFRNRRWRAYGRRASWGNRGTRAQSARLRLPPHRSAPGPWNPNRGGTSRTRHVSRETLSGG